MELTQKLFCSALLRWSGNFYILYTLNAFSNIYHTNQLKRGAIVHIVVCFKIQQDGYRHQLSRPVLLCHKKL